MGVNTRLKLVDTTPPMPVCVHFVLTPQVREKQSTAESNSLPHTLSLSLSPPLSHVLKADPFVYVQAALEPYGSIFYTSRHKHTDSLPLSLEQVFTCVCVCPGWH